MCVPYPRRGVWAKASSILFWEPVNGSASWFDELKVTRARRWLTLRRAAKVRAALIAPRIGAPCMLLLASITSAAPNDPPAWLAGTTVWPSTGFPFSSTLKREGTALGPDGSVTTIARSGHEALPVGATSTPERAAAVAARAAAAASADARAMTKRLLTASAAPGQARRYRAVPPRGTC